MPTAESRFTYTQTYRVNPKRACESRCGAVFVELSRWQSALRRKLSVRLVTLIETAVLDGKPLLRNHRRRAGFRFRGWGWGDLGGPRRFRRRPLHGRSLDRGGLPLRRRRPFRGNHRLRLARGALFHDSLRSRRGPRRGWFYRRGRLGLPDSRPSPSLSGSHPLPGLGAHGALGRGGRDRPGAGRGRRRRLTA